MAPVASISALSSICSISLRSDSARCSSSCFFCSEAARDISAAFFASAYTRAIAIEDLQDRFDFDNPLLLQLLVERFSNDDVVELTFDMLSSGVILSSAFFPRPHMHTLNNQ